MVAKWDKALVALSVVWCDPYMATADTVIGSKHTARQAQMSLQLVLDAIRAVMSYNGGGGGGGKWGGA